MHQEAARTRKRGAAGQTSDHASTTADQNSGTTAEGFARDSRHALVDEVNREPDLYRVLGLSQRTSKVDEIRRAYIARSRICHPE